MTVLIVIVIILALLMQISLGVDAAYNESGFTLCATVCGAAIQLIPGGSSGEEKPKKKKKEKPKKEKPPAQPSKESKPKKEKKKGLPLGLNGDEIIGLLKTVLSRLGRFGRKFRMDRLLFHYVGGGDDPYQTAMVFGYINAGISTLAPVARKTFNIGSYDIMTDVDFTRDTTDIDFGIGVSLKIGAVFSLIFGILFGVIGILIRNRVRIWGDKICGIFKPKSAQPDALGEAEVTADSTEQAG